jgi:hypothetical protein
LAGNSEEKRLFGKPRHSWKDHMNMCLRERGLGVMDRIHLAQDMDQWRAFVGTVMNLPVP